MAQKSKEYWAKRAEQRENRAYAKGVELSKKLKREYTRAAKEIRQKLDAFYGRYATEQGLSYAEAVKKLNSKEAREWKRTLGEYVEEINALPDGKAKSKLIAELDARSYASQQDRLSSLAAQIDMEVDRLFASGEQQMTMTMTDVIEDGYLHKVFDLQQRAGIIEPFARLSTEMIENALSYPWSGADFSSRLWENKRTLLFNMRQTITQGLIQGQSVPVMAKGLADSLGKSYVAAERLIRTETSHFHNVADISAYEAAGVTQYEYMASLDERTCPICGAMDGKHFDVEEAQAGVNYAPMHPNCRCTTIEYDPEDAADWAASGKPMPENMTYAEWKEQQDDMLEMAADGGINWPQKGASISKQQYKELMQYASEKGIRMQGFKHFDGNLDTAKWVVDDASEMLKLYPGVNNGRRKLTVSLGEETMDSRNFATTDGRIITINPKAFRDESRLEEEYQKLVDAGWFVHGTDRRAIIKHEFGHVVSNCYRLDGLSITKKILRTDSDAKVLEYCLDNISEYSAAYSDGREIISECFASVYNSKNQSEFALTFVEECANLILEKEG